MNVAAITQGRPPNKKPEDFDGSRMPVVKHTCSRLLQHIYRVVVRVPGNKRPSEAAYRDDKQSQINNRHGVYRAIVRFEPSWLHDFIHDNVRNPSMPLSAVQDNFSRFSIESQFKTRTPVYSAANRSAEGSSAKQRADYFSGSASKGGAVPE
jgi:hypothetical protein